MHSYKDEISAWHISGYTKESIEINNISYHEPIIICPRAGVSPWSIADFNQIDADAITALTERTNPSPQTIILGTGSQQHWLTGKLISICHSRKIGIEVMPTGAACRSYNIMVADGHSVLAALLI